MPDKPPPSLAAFPTPCCFVYDPVGEHAFLSNYAMTPIDDGERIWPTAEHLFQAAKFDDQNIRAEIARAVTGADAKAIAWSRAFASKVLPDWNQRRVEVMRTVLTLKFDQSLVARSALTDTWPQPIFEDSPSDEFWGVGPSGQGLNVLGVLLEEQRRRFTKFPDLFEASATAPPFPQGGSSHTRSARVRRRPNVIVAATTRRLAYEPFQQLDIRRQLTNTIKSEDHKSAIDNNGRFYLHAELLDTKYGNYQWTEDARSVVPNWIATFEGVVAARAAKSVRRSSIVVVGAGSANETASVWRRFGRRVTLVDWGIRLTENCRREAPQARVLRRRAEDLTGISNDSKEIYFSLRTYDSALISISAALKEASRVLQPDGLIVITISDGYLMQDGGVVRGQIGLSGDIDRSASWTKMGEIVSTADTLGFTDFSFFDLQSEIGFCAVSPPVFRPI